LYKNNISNQNLTCTTNFTTEAVIQLTCSWGAVYFRDTGMCRWPWWRYGCTGPHIPPCWNNTTHL